MLTLLLMLVTPATAKDAGLAALRDELDRSAAELSLPDAARPHHLAYRVNEGWFLDAYAELGGIVSLEHGPFRSLGVDMRVGSAQLDSANFEDRWKGDGFRYARLPLEPLPLAMRRVAWLESDRAYKEAVDNLARKEAAERRTARVDPTPDHAAGVVTVVHGPVAAPADADALVERVRDLSAALRDHPGVGWSEAGADVTLGRTTVLDSAGLHVEQPAEYTDLFVNARVRTTDGSVAHDRVEWLVRRPEDLPPDPQLAQAVDAMAERLTRWSALPLAQAEYVGPVVIEGDAAIALVERLLLPALEGTPPEGKAPEGSRGLVFGENAGGAAALRVKRRVLPPGWTLTDDPQRDPGLPSSFAYDVEGQPAVALTLVDDGIVRTHFSSRTPSASVPDSNGHARGSTGQMPRGGPSQVELSAPRELSSGRLHKKALSLAAAYDQDGYVRIRRFQHPAAAAADPDGTDSLQGYFFGDDDRAEPLDTLDVVWVHADGREEPVRGWSLAGLDVRMLRDVAAAGRSRTRTLWHQVSGLDGEVAVTVTAPTLLLGEVELVVDDSGGQRPPLLPSPLAEK